MKKFILTLIILTIGPVSQGLAFEETVTHTLKCVSKDEFQSYNPSNEWFTVQCYTQDSNLLGCDLYIRSVDSATDLQKVRLTVSDQNARKAHLINQEFAVKAVVKKMRCRPR